MKLAIGVCFVILAAACKSELDLRNKILYYI